MSDVIVTDPALLAWGAPSPPPGGLSPNAPGWERAPTRPGVARVRRPGGMKKRAHTTLSEKVMIINFIKENPSWDQATVAKHFQQHGFPTLSQSTISRYIKDEERYRSLALDPAKWGVKKQKQARPPQVVHCIQFWAFQCLGKAQASALPDMDDVLRQKWADFAGLLSARSRKRAALPPQWLGHLKHQLRGFRSPFEPKPAPPTSLSAELARIRAATDLYALGDVLAVDEVGLAYSCPPAEPASLFSQPKLTVLLTCSADGRWKGTPLVVGQSPQAVVYPPEQISECPDFQYHWNTHAVMTFAIWHRYLVQLDETCRQRRRKVLLLADPTHVHLWPEPGLANVRIEYIDTAREFIGDPAPGYGQPFEAGIAKYFKSEYRVRFCLRALSSDEYGLADLYNIDQGAATRLIHSAWDCVAPDAIEHAFRHSGAVSVRNDDDLPLHGVSYEAPQDIIVQDPLIEQSVASLTMCLTQLTIKVMNLYEQAAVPPVEDSPTPGIDANICPELAKQEPANHLQAQATPPSVKPEEQIVTANEFIDIDSSLPTELDWDDQDIIEQVSREVREGDLYGGDDTTHQWPNCAQDLALDPCIDVTLKRGSSSLDDYGDIMVMDPTNRVSLGRKRRPRHSFSNSCENSLTDGVQEATEPKSWITGKDDQSNKDRSSFRNDLPGDESLLSIFSSHITSIESLRQFCHELIEEDQLLEELMVNGGRTKSSIIKECLPILSALEEEFRALEAADLLRNVSG